MTEFIINKSCPCKYACPRHGNCKACVENHKKRGTPTACGKNA